MNAPSPILFFDTNQWRSLSIEKEIAKLLPACRAGEVRIILSQFVLYEYGRQYFQRQQRQLFAQLDFLEYLINCTMGDILKAYIHGFRVTFENHGVEIIDHSGEFEEVARQLIDDEGTYFSAADKSDQRDARILAAALGVLKPEASLVFTGDKKLGTEFDQRGFRVHQNARDYIATLGLGRPEKIHDMPNLQEALAQVRSGRSAPFDELFHRVIQSVDETYYQLFLPDAVLEVRPDVDVQSALDQVKKMSADDHEVRLWILCYVSWFAPIAVDELFLMLEKRQISRESLQSNSERLVRAGVIRSAGKNFLPGGDGICDAIGNSRLDELAEILKADDNET